MSAGVECIYLSNRAMTYKLQCIIIMTSLFMVELASATEFNINAIDKDQRGSVDLSLFKDQISITEKLIGSNYNINHL